MFAADTADTLITLDPLLLSLLAGAVIPLITALITKVGASNVVRVLISMFLSALAGTLIQINNQGGTFELKETVVAFVVTFITAVTSYVGFWQPVVNANATVAPSVGIGPKAQ